MLVVAKERLNGLSFFWMEGDDLLNILVFLQTLSGCALEKRIYPIIIQKPI
jgi:hypothetical protein